MKATLFQLTGNYWEAYTAQEPDEIKAAQLVFCFAAKEKLAATDIYSKISTKFPSAQVVMCSTAHHHLC